MKEFANPSGNRAPGQSKSTFWIIGALVTLLAIAPVGQEPHLWQKLILLWHGWLKTLLDWFDLAIHGLPLISFIGYAIYGKLRKESRNKTSTDF
ncbi:MAG: hypothetical protein RH862_14560 [Leptospiraceae bacterium]